MATLHVVLANGETRAFVMRDDFRQERIKIERGEGVIRVIEGNVEGAVYLRNALAVLVSQ